MKIVLFSGIFALGLFACKKSDVLNNEENILVESRRSGVVMTLDEFLEEENSFATSNLEKSEVPKVGKTNCWIPQRDGSYKIGKRCDSATNEGCDITVSCLAD